MTDTDVLAAHGFSRGQCARAVSKHPHKRTPVEQALIAALVSLEQARGA
jgi:hypothetical protein